MKLHHTGFIVADIDQYEKNMLFEEKVKDVLDPVQNGRLSLYRNFSNSFIELIQPLNEEAFTYNFLQKGGNNFHHFCYEIDSETELKTIVLKNKLILVKGPVPAVLFDNRSVYFYYSRNKQVVEFLL